MINGEAENRNSQKNMIGLCNLGFCRDILDYRGGEHEVDFSGLLRLHGETTLKTITFVASSRSSLYMFRVYIS
jgi:hypothetical protein